MFSYMFCLEKSGKFFSLPTVLTLLTTHVQVSGRISVNVILPVEKRLKYCRENPDFSTALSDVNLIYKYSPVLS